MPEELELLPLPSVATSCRASSPSELPRSPNSSAVSVGDCFRVVLWVGKYFVHVVVKGAHVLVLVLG